MELWDKMFNFEDNIGLFGTQNDHPEKKSFLWINFSNLTTWNRVMGQNIQF